MALSDAVTTLKATGNEQFRENDFLRAAASYSKALKLASKEGCERCVRADASRRLRYARCAPERARPRARSRARRSKTKRAADSRSFSRASLPSPLRRSSPELAPIYSNRSASLLKLLKVSLALADAEKCIELRPDWDKAHFRKAAVLEEMRDDNGALRALEAALEVASTQEQIGVVEAKIKLVKQRQSRKQRIAARPPSKKNENDGGEDDGVKGSAFRFDGGGAASADPVKATAEMVANEIRAKAEVDTMKVTAVVAERKKKKKKGAKGVVVEDAKVAQRPWSVENDPLVKAVAEAEAAAAFPATDPKTEKKKGAKRKKSAKPTLEQAASLAAAPPSKPEPTPAAPAEETPAAAAAAAGEKIEGPAAVTAEQPAPAAATMAAPAATAPTTGSATAPATKPVAEAKATAPGIEPPAPAPLSKAKARALRARRKAEAKRERGEGPRGTALLEKNGGGKAKAEGEGKGMAGWALVFLGAAAAGVAAIAISAGKVAKRN